MDLVKKIADGVRLTMEDANSLYDLPLNTLGQLADSIRKSRFGNKSYFNINR
ncbi:MAG: aminofutalosine synthase MqnE, partial [Epsilonproteobacteria bacterium]|nr:aminofutalosine synthase MqnE [Campylobacterota bacterium]